MISRQIFRHCPKYAFSSSAVAFDRGLVPSIGDITHTSESVSQFQERAKNFREAAAEARRLATSMKTVPAPATTADGTQATTTDEEPKKGGIVKSILYGSEEGQRMQAELEQSYSKILARGKYVHAIEIHQVKPIKVEQYIKLIGEIYPKIAADKGMNCHLVGSWKTEIGDADTFVHIWEYQGYAGYHHTVNRINATPALHDPLRKFMPRFVRHRRTDLMQEFSFWPTTAPRKFGGIFELRSYTLRPGHLMDWEQHWRAGLNARKNVMEGVGAWFTQIGELNRVHYLWQFPDLRARQMAREKSWGEKGWSSTVHKTVPLIERMESRIMVPLPWSPVA